MLYFVLAIFSLAALVALAGAVLVYRRGVHRWMVPYVTTPGRRHKARNDEPVHALIAICDHYEPHNGGADDARAMDRVHAWAREYPRVLGGFRDSDGRPPRHSFFYPLEQYHRAEMDVIASICRQGFGEVEVHLHHDHDTSASLRRRFLEYKEMLWREHGLLPRHRKTGELMYGFIHGNWALDNSRPDGLWCGVNDELDVLRDTGCYADFTLPSAPSPTQTPTINSIYYATDDPRRPRSHDHGVSVGTQPRPTDSLMLIQGPLLLNWHSRKWGLLPRIENATVQGRQYPTMQRLDLWLSARVQVRTRPDWFFVKLHTHGAPEDSHKLFFGDPMTRFHAQLAARAKENPNFHYHYVTAREMYNLARAAEDGFTGTVDDARDYELVWEPSGPAPVAREAPATSPASVH